MIWILTDFLSLMQDGLTGSAWGDWANYTASPLRAFENELGVQAQVPPCKFHVLLIIVFPVSPFLHLSKHSTSHMMWLCLGLQFSNLAATFFVWMQLFGHGFPRIRIIVKTSIKPKSGSHTFELKLFFLSYGASSS